MTLSQHTKFQGVKKIFNSLASRGCTFVCVNEKVTATCVDAETRFFLRARGFGPFADKLFSECAVVDLSSLAAFCASDEKKVRWGRGRAAGTSIRAVIAVCTLL